jgi:hypothetical protein
LPMQVPGTANFGSEGRVVIRERHLLKHRVLCKSASATSS